ncbi:E3 ubiquitin-protein ligase TRIM39-like [Anolis sagrei]|uniref:E3 ubiquitin-protein ligase TRIM39-like n=1 Tax=Anolis sagrei TaxID=38937 RepID=UPI0035222189
MASAEDLLDELTCPICLGYFEDPVTLAGCGHNFCQSCLTQSYGERERQAACPQCRKGFQIESLTANRQLGNVVEIAKKMQEGREKRGEGHLCQKHQEPLKLFCKEDEVPICVVCDRAKAHKGHEVVPLEEAPQDYKEKIASYLKSLKKLQEEICAFKTQTDTERKVLLKQTKAGRKKTVAAFKELHRFLEQQEKLLLSQIKEVEKEIASRRDKHMANLSEELSSLENIIREMELKCLQPASEFLQDIKSTLQRCEAKKEFKKPDVFPLELKWKIWDSGDIAVFLEGAMKQVRDELISGFKLQKANVTLDPDTAHGHLILSEDRKSITCGDKSQNLPDNLKRFDEETSVLGCVGFTSGRHFWEICVGEEDQWLVGVARKSMERKGDIDYRPEGGIWAIGKWGGAYKVTNSPHYLTLSLNSELKRIRVSLNYTGGQVAFYNADTRDHLYSFSGASFIGETLLPFFNVYEKGYVRISP